GSRLHRRRDPHRVPALLLLRALLRPLADAVCLHPDRAHRDDAALRREPRRADGRRRGPPLGRVRPRGAGMTRVAYFAPLLFTGGTQRHLQQVLRHLDPRRFAAHVYTLRSGGELTDELRAAGVAVTSLELGERLTRPRVLAGVIRAARLLRAARVDVVHGYQWRPALIGALAGRLGGARLLVAGKRSLTGADRPARLAWRVIARAVDTIVANADALRVEAEADGIRARWAIIPSGVDVEHLRGSPSPAAAKAALGLDARRGVVGPPGDPAALAGAAVARLADPRRAAALAGAAGRAVEERFSARQMVARLERLYTERLEAAA